MRKYAAIDIGTNSMRLLLMTVETDRILHRTKEINTTRIGQSVDERGAITREGMERNLGAFEDFVEKAREYGAEEIYAIATSAVRDAKNGEVFVGEALQRTGIKIAILSGEEEAGLGYKGVLMGLKNPELELLVIDIGGGSTEFILGKSATLQETISENVGAVRMTERLITTDPITQQEKEGLEKVIKKELHSTLQKLQKKQIKGLIGIGGTITTLGALHQQLDPYDMDKIHNYTLTLQNIKDLLQKLETLTLEERKALKGIHPKRGDIIIAGTTILRIIMETLAIDTITISEYDNIEGLLYENM
ncbi:Ppx/GppA phosphatase family protein [Natronincola ferrireducens]|uniref:Exopolyphosphatase / guanosine-5'-triphosphate,3'-diphosphate pyrophosphatase n=1 Tax=Natronincola ferrireducens TaxID=393762 RepID=A0A1G8WZT8_9FIRM|nr:Ppx/GppA phosphatase family protein [Natronincola ferrireducens]SDJ83908.1 exopolyphosphatase / guanosine-5'-triphosphate,3'-diphosphate pyrophosphatase [Natronincola ferrireducens]